MLRTISGEVEFGGEPLRRLTVLAQYVEDVWATQAARAMLIVGDTLPMLAVAASWDGRLTEQFSRREFERYPCHVVDVSGRWCTVAPA